MKRDRIYLSPPHLSGDEGLMLEETLDSNWIAPLGPQVDAFEREFAAAVDLPYAAALSSGTAALHLALLLLEVGSVAGGVRQVIFASTGGAIYGEQDYFPAREDHPTRPVSPYGVSKLAGERYLYYFHVQFGLDVCCLRYANVYGERQNPHGEAGVVAIFLTKLLGREACTINGDGLQTRDYVHVSDVARANLAALRLEGFRTYNVGTGIETNVVDLYRALTATLGVERDPAHAPGKPGEQRRSSLDTASASRDLQLPPTVGLEHGLEQTARWFREFT